MLIHINPEAFLFRKLRERGKSTNWSLSKPGGGLFCSHALGCFLVVTFSAIAFLCLLNFVKNFLLRKPLGSRESSHHRSHPDPRDDKLELALQTRSIAIAEPADKLEASGHRILL